MDKSRLSEKQLLILQSEMEMRRRSTLIAYILFFFLAAGVFGGHQWYLRNYGRAISYPALSGVVAALMIYYRDKTPPTNFFVIGLTVYFLSWAFDAVTLAWQVGRSNRRIEREIIKSLEGLHSDQAREPSFQSTSTDSLKR